MSKETENKEQGELSICMEIAGAESIEGVEKDAPTAK